MNSTRDPGFAKDGKHDSLNTYDVIKIIHYTQKSHLDFPEPDNNDFILELSDKETNLKFVEDDLNIWREYSLNIFKFVQKCIREV